MELAAEAVTTTKVAEVVAEVVAVVVTSVVTSVVVVAVVEVPVAIFAATSVADVAGVVVEHLDSMIWLIVQHPRAPLAVVAHLLCHLESICKFLISVQHHEASMPTCWHIKALLLILNHSTF